MYNVCDSSLLYACITTQLATIRLIVTVILVVTMCMLFFLDIHNPLIAT